MKTEKTEKILSAVTVVTVHCDRCKQEIKTERGDEFESEITFQRGYRDGYQGFIGEKFYVDLCEPCAMWLFEEIFPQHNINVNEDW